MIFAISTLLGVATGLTRSLASVTLVAVSITAAFALAAATGPSSIISLLLALAGYNVGLMAIIGSLVVWLKLKSLMERVQTTANS
ncbi:hypothetical protein [Oryzifoliimicrobium ureilyticus]|uniref:hypothetical protein n=1 Tax=Oryzifoliimicrobium ureilyticus TaxID=3113724 RepID=UPI0030763A6F